MMKKTRCRSHLLCLWSLLLVPLCSCVSAEMPVDAAKAAASYRKANQPVRPLPDGSIMCEAEEFRVEQPGWQAMNWESAYYCATFANSFLSRKAFLGAPAQCERTVASVEVQVPAAGRYLALVRYEAVYRFETQFKLRIIQNNNVALDRLYGARDNLKVWAFSERLKKEVAWYWGAVENNVWEGHDAYVQLQPGIARLELVAEKQPGDAAERHVDVIVLTTDEEQVKTRIAKEGYLPLDGMLTQAGDVYVKLHNEKDGSRMTLTIPPATQHSPYWVHMRNWKPVAVEAEPGQSTDWVEVGSVLDSLNDGQWVLTAQPKDKGAALHYRVEMGVQAAGGNVEPARTFESRSDSLALAYDANTRYTRRVRPLSDVLYDLLAYLKRHPVRGKCPERTLIICYTFDPNPNDKKYTAALGEFIKMMGLTGFADNREDLPGSHMPTGYSDVRGSSVQEVEKFCKELQAQGKAKNMAVISLGDEIGLATPPADSHEAFRASLKAQGLKPSDVDPAAGDDWGKVQYAPDEQTAKAKPGLYYFSQRFKDEYGIAQQKIITDVLRRYLPNAGIGANYSPHPSPAFLGETNMWVTLFRKGGMTMPWSEDYIWQIPVGTQQMDFLNIDLFRAALKGNPQGKIHFYVMPHSPGNTVNSWRRLFYGTIAHGTKIINLFEFRPVQAAYTENHSSLPEMYLEVRRAFYELGLFEDIVQDGQVRPGVAALWFGETGDMWNDNRDPFASGKRTLYITVRHQQLSLDMVTESDAVAGELKNYRVLYLADQHVSRAASKAIADWVGAGGRLFATAGAGMFNEMNQPNTVLRELLGAEQTKLDENGAIKFEKQDLPFAEPLDTVTWNSPEGQAKMPVFGARSRFQAKGAEVAGTFGDGSPAITVKKTGKGSATYCAFLPGLTYFKPAMPRRPVDRGTTDEAMAHFIPTDFDAGASRLVNSAALGVERAVVCSEPLVETTVIESKHGVLISLTNWSGKPVKGLTVTVSIGVPTAKVALASGAPVQVAKEQGKTVFTLDLEVADALMLR